MTVWETLEPRKHGLKVSAAILDCYGADITVFMTGGIACCASINTGNSFGRTLNTTHAPILMMPSRKTRILKYPFIPIQEMIC